MQPLQPQEATPWRAKTLEPILAPATCCIISGLACSEGSDPEEWRHLAALGACVCSEQAVPHTADSSEVVGTGWSLGRDATMNCHQALASLQDKLIPSPTGPVSGEDARSQGQTSIQLWLA